MTWIALDTEAARDVARAGGKGASLARAIADGHRVPPGLVLSADAVRPLREPGARLSDELRRALGEALGALRRPGALYAVRSSAVAEDGESASFAGQYLTRLGVPEEALEDAVLEVARSFGAAHADAYQRARGQQDAGAAIVVQRLVPARAAGVAFGLDPSTGDDTVVVVEANHGLGESVVSGEASPDGYRIKKSTLDVDCRIGGKEVKAVLVDGGSELVPTTPAERAARVLTDDEARAVAALAETLAELAGHPVDLEWALDDDGLHLLQSRPITAVADGASVPAAFRAALDTPVDPAFPLYSSGNIGEVLPGVLSPLAFSTVLPVIDRAFRAQLEETGAMVDPSPGLRVVGFFYQRAYLNVSYLCEAADRSPGISRDRVLEEFVGKVTTPTPAFRAADFTPRGLARTARAITRTVARLRRLDAEAERVVQSVRADHLAATDEFARGLSDDALAAAVRIDAAAAAPSIVHVWASTFAVTTFGVLRALLETWAGDTSGGLAAELVTGLTDLPSADPAYALHALARAVRAEPALADAYAAAPSRADKLTVLRGARSSDGAGPQLEAFLARHGHRGVNEAEPMTPSWRQDPTQIIPMLDAFLDPRAVDPEAQRRARTERRTALEAEVRAKLGPLRRFVFDRLLVRVRRFVSLREQLKDAIVLRADRQRVFYRELGRRLVSRGQLDASDDVPMLRVEELARAVVSPDPRVDLRRIVRARRREYALCRAVDVPKLLEGAPRREGQLDLPAADTLSGLGVCPGVVVGRARIVHDPRVDVAPTPGEILVAPVTDAGWTPLFVQASAMVVEVGGLLSHGSVVARELGLPTVVGVAHATRRIRTGDMLRVDGTLGTVTWVRDDATSATSTTSSAPNSATLPS